MTLVISPVARQLVDPQRRTRTVVTVLLMTPHSETSQGKEVRLVDCAGVPADDAWTRHEVIVGAACVTLRACGGPGMASVQAACRCFRNFADIETPCVAHLTTHFGRGKLLVESVKHQTGVW